MGTMAIYIVFQSHVLCTDEGYVFVPRQPAIVLTDSYVDVRGWRESDWKSHPKLVAALHQANREDLLQPQQSFEVEKPLDEPVPLRRMQARNDSNSKEVTGESFPFRRFPVEESERSQITPDPLDPVSIGENTLERRWEQSPNRTEPQPNSGVDGLQDRFLRQLDDAYWDARSSTGRVIDRARTDLGDAGDDLFDRNPNYADPFRDASEQFRSQLER